MKIPRTPLLLGLVLIGGCSSNAARDEQPNDKPSNPCLVLFGGPLGAIAECIAEDSDEEPVVIEARVPIF